MDEDEAEDAWQLLRAAVAQREAEEGMEESDSVLRRVQREAGFPEACPVHRLDYATSGCLAVALTQEGASDTVWKSKFYGVFVLNHRVVLHAIDATPARRRGSVCLSRRDSASTVDAPDALIDFHTGRTSRCSGGKGPWTRPTRPWSRGQWLVMKV